VAITIDRQALLAVAVRETFALPAERFLAAPDDFRLAGRLAAFADEARIFFATMTPAAVAAAAPTTAATTPAVRDFVSELSAFEARLVNVPLEREVEEVFDFMGVERGSNSS
jgi:hypothetical protein